MNLTHLAKAKPKTRSSEDKLQLKQLSQLFIQGLTPQIFGDDFAVPVQKKTHGEGRDIVGLGHG